MDITENYRILTYGPRMVNVESEPVLPHEFDDLPRLRRYMRSVLKKADGVGLAAPQIGVFKNVVIVERETGGMLDLVNPTITRMYGKEIEGLEGCLSLPPSGNECLVPRVDLIDIEASTVSAPDVIRKFTFRSYTSRIVQHELDHLNGTFFIDRVSEKKRRVVLERFHEWLSRHRAKMRQMQKESNHVDAGFVSSCGGTARLQ